MHAKDETHCAKESARQLGTSAKVLELQASFPHPHLLTLDGYILKFVL